MKRGNLRLGFFRIPAIRPPTMERMLEPELLDALPPEHPDALHNRRDLRLTNRVMRNHVWIAQTLPSLVRNGERVLEIGAGTGELAHLLAQAGVAADALDLWPKPDNWPQDRTWHTADLRLFREWHRYPVVLGNLIFHQFSDAELRALGKNLSGARVIVACEPTRRRVSQILYAAIAPLLGANHVTLHDARVSIAAGFLGEELPHTLGLDRSAWNIHCSTTGMGAYHMVATRRA